MKTNLFLSLILLLLFSCQPSSTPMVIPLNRDYDWKITLSSDWQKINAERMQELDERGKEVLSRRGNVETDGFRELFTLEKGKSKLFATVGTHKKAHGGYEDMRMRRAFYYQEQFQTNITTSSSLDSIDITLGDLPLKKYTIQIDFQTPPNSDFPPQYLITDYEGLLDEQKFLVIYAQTPEKAIMEELLQMIESSRIVRR